jgi:SAM-dependent methyltransferase
MLSLNEEKLLSLMIDEKSQKQSIELEARITRGIEADRFKNLAKSLDNAGYIRVDNPEVMDINFYASDKRDNLSIRYTITGLDNIRAYCKLENATVFNKLYKSRVNWTQKSIDEMVVSKIRDSYKNEAMTFDVPNLGIRFNSKEEILFSEENKRFPNKIAQDSYNDLQTLILKVGWENILKSFRFKKRTSFLTSDRQFSIDLTIIKSNKKTISLSGREDMFPTKTFKESNTLNEKETYEVEIEYLGTIDSPDKKQDVLNTFQQLSNLVLAKLFYKTPNVITSELQSLVIKDYVKCVQNMLRDAAKSKIVELEELAIELKKPESSRNMSKFKTPFSLYTTHYDQLSKLESEELLEENAIYKSLKSSLDMISKGKGIYGYDERNKSKYFYVPKVVSMGVENIQASYPYNILEGYSVTDKADGETMILFAPNTVDGIYMIDSNLEVDQLSSNSIDDIKGTIIAGEYINSDRNGNEIAMFAAFDTYLYKNRDIRSLPLVSSSSENRTGIAKTALKMISLPFIQLVTKEFYSGDNIFKLSKVVWDKYENGGFIYRLDGLIYTPVETPVAFDNVRYDYFIQMASRWNLNMKWKPPHENTIDFLVNIQKERIDVDAQKGIYIEREKIRYKTVVNGEKVDFIPYKTVELYCGFKLSLSNNPCLNIKTPTLSKDAVKYIPTRFTPTNPYNELAYIAHIPCDEMSGSNIFGLNDKIKIMDNTIVEFGYDLTKPVESEEDKHFRWFPLRTRIEKTNQYITSLKNKERLFRIYQKYSSGGFEKGYKWSYSETKELRELKILIRRFGLTQMGSKEAWDGPDPTWIYQTLQYGQNKKILNLQINGSNDIPLPISYGNDFEVANAIWRSIYYPITTEMITTGEDVPSTSDQEILYYNRENSRDKSATINMQHFHNKIKNIELLGAGKALLKSESDIHLLDLATGKGGDLYKWKDNKISNVVGVDLFNNNIYDSKDGACVRYVEFKKRMEAYKNEFIPTVHYLHGDVSKNIKSGEAMKSEHSIELQKSLWNKSDIYDTIYSVNKFDMVSIQFAIHYMFQEPEKLNGLLQNIKDNLKPDGIFIGCCFDGNSIYNDLYKKALGDSIEGYSSDNKLIWRIRKQYQNTDKDVLDENSPLGMAIDVYLHSINQSIREYLVSYDYLVRRMSEIDLEPVSTAMFGDIYHKYKEHPEFKQYLDSMSKDERRLSFYNRLFIFKKKSGDNIIIDEIYNEIDRIKQLPSINKALNHGVKKKEWHELGVELSHLNIKYSDVVFKGLIQKIIDNVKSGNLVLEPLRKKAVVELPKKMAVAEEEKPKTLEEIVAIEKQKIAKPVPKEVEPIPKAAKPKTTLVEAVPKEVEPTPKVVETVPKAVEPVPKVADIKTRPDYIRFINNFKKFEPILGKLLLVDNREKLEKALHSLEQIRDSYKPEFDEIDKYNQIVSIIEKLKVKLE